MRRITFIIAPLMTISLWGASMPSNGVWAASSPPVKAPAQILTDLAPIPIASAPSTSTTAPKLVIDIRDNRLTLRADGAGIREILKTLEMKTGTRYVIHEGVPDEKRSINLSSVSLRDTDTLLRKLSLNNYILTYDRKEAQSATYILPEGYSHSDFLNGRPQLIAIRNAFKQPTYEEIKTVKGKPIETFPQKDGRGTITYVRGEVLIKYHRGVTEEEQRAILSKYGLARSSTDQSLANLGYTKALLPQGKDLSSLLKELIQERRIKTPEPNYILKTTLQVNDPLYINQWYVPETRFDTAWDHLKSTKTIPVAVIDTGIDASHPDLRSKLLPGYDFVHNTSTPIDDHGHGTFVAGIIGAQADTTGIRGLYDQARILPVKVMDENGLGTYEDAAKGIVWAVDQGARVINLSIGGYGYSYLLQDAVDYALEKGCIVVAAGGNDGIDQPIYPAAYPDVIGVAALADDGKIWASSNRGKHIDVSAPGDHILSTGIHGEYAYASGTSAATPMVSALAAIIANERSDLSPAAIERLIQQSARDLGDKGRDKTYGAGLIDAQAALSQTIRAFHDVAVRSVHVEPMVFEKGKPTYIVANIENRGTYKSEKFDVVLYEIVGEGKKEIGRQERVDIVDKTKVIFDWMPAVVEENIKFEVSIVCTQDSNKANNSRKTNIFSLKEEEGLFVLHSNKPPVHGWIAYQAYKQTQSTNSALYNEMASYIGPTSDSSSYLSGSWTPSSTTHTSNWPNSYSAPYCPSTPCTTAVIEGAWEEDENWGVSVIFLNHFWDPTGGYNDGLYNTSITWDSALKRAQETTFVNAINNYLANPQDKNAAYYWLGRTAHLLTDMGVPAHTLEDQHAGYDSFESYVGYKDIEAYKRYNSTNASPITETYNLYTPSSYDPALTSLFYGLANKANDYDTDDYPGEISSGKYNVFDYRFVLPTALYTNTGAVSSVVWYRQCNSGNTNDCQSAQTLALGMDYEYDIGEHIDEPPAIYVYDHVGSAFDENNAGWLEGPYDVLKVTYKNSSGTTTTAYLENYDYILYYYDLVPSSLFVEETASYHSQQKILQSYAIGNVAALYHLFWDKTHGSLSGTVIDKNTKSPISNAAVAIYKDGSSTPVDGQSTHYTDSNGKFTFTDLEGGSYLIRITNSNYSTGTSPPVIVYAGVSSNIRNIELTPTLTPPTTGMLSISTTPVNGVIYVNGQNKGTGSWSGSLATGSYIVTFGYVSGYNTPTDKEAIITGGQTTTITGIYSNASDPKISGYVRASDGSPISGVTMVFENNGSAPTDNNGYYTKAVNSGWSGTVTPIKNYYTFSQPKAYLHVTSNQPNQNYTGAYSTPGISLASPNGGEDWQMGTQHIITWSSQSNVGTNVKIELYKGGVPNYTIVSNALNNNSYSWLVPDTLAAGTDYKIRVTSTTNTTYFDESNSNFSISAGIADFKSYYYWDFNTDGSEGWAGRNAVDEGIYAGEYWIVNPVPDTASKSGIISPDGLTSINTNTYNALEVRAAVQNTYVSSLQAFFKINGQWYGPKALNYVSGAQQADSQIIYRGTIDYTGQIQQGRIDFVWGSNSVDDRLYIDYVKFINWSDSTSPMVSIGAPYQDESITVNTVKTIQFSASDNISVDHIDVEYSSNGGSSFASIAGCTGLSGMATTCAWTPTATTNTAMIKVQAYDSTGNTGQSTVGFKVAPVIQYVQKSTEMPNAPELYSIGTSTSVNWVTLNWKKVIDTHYYDNVNYYEVQYADNSSFTNAQIINAGNTATNTNMYETISYKVNGLQDTKTYYFRIRATNNVGTGGWSNYESIKIDIQDYPYFDTSYQVPSNGAINISKAPILRWRALDADGDKLDYYVAYGTSPNSVDWTLRAFASPQHSFQDSFDFSTEYYQQLKPGTKYYWQVWVREDGRFRDYYGGEYIKSPVWNFTTVSTGSDLDISSIEQIGEVKPKSKATFRITIRNIGSEKSASNRIDANYIKGAKDTPFWTVENGNFPEINPGGLIVLDVIVGFRESIWISTSNVEYDNVLVSGPSSIRFKLAYDDPQDTNKANNQKLQTINYIDAGGPVITYFDLREFGSMYEAWSTKFWARMGQKLRIIVQANDDIMVAKGIVQYRLHSTDSWTTLYTQMNQGEFFQFNYDESAWQIPTNIQSTNEAQIRVLLYDDKNNETVKTSNAFSIYSNRIDATIAPNNNAFMVNGTLTYNVSSSSDNTIAGLSVRLLYGAGIETIKELYNANGITVAPQYTWSIPNYNYYSSRYCYLELTLTDVRGNSKTVRSSVFTIDPNAELPSPFNTAVVLYSDEFNFPANAMYKDQNKSITFIKLDDANVAHAVVEHSYRYWQNTASGYSEDTYVYENNKYYITYNKLTNTISTKILICDKKYMVEDFEIIDGIPYALLSNADNRNPSSYYNQSYYTYKSGSSFITPVAIENQNAPSIASYTLLNSKVDSNLANINGKIFVNGYIWILDIFTHVINRYSYSSGTLGNSEQVAIQNNAGTVESYSIKPVSDGNIIYFISESNSMLVKFDTVNLIASSYPLPFTVGSDFNVARKVSLASQAGRVFVFGNGRVYTLEGSSIVEKGHISYTVNGSTVDYADKWTDVDFSKTIMSDSTLYLMLGESFYQAKPAAWTTYEILKFDLSTYQFSKSVAQTPSNGYVTSFCGDNEASGCQSNGGRFDTQYIGNNKTLIGWSTNYSSDTQLNKNVSYLMIVDMETGAMIPVGKLPFQGHDRLSLFYISGNIYAIASNGQNYLSESYRLNLSNITATPKRIENAKFVKYNSNLYAHWGGGNPYDGTWNYGQNMLNNYVERKNKGIRIYPTLGTVYDVSAEYLGDNINTVDSYLSSNYGEIYTLNSDFTVNQKVYDDGIYYNPLTFKTFDYSYIAALNYWENGIKLKLFKNDLSLINLNLPSQTNKLAVFNNEIIVGGYGLDATNGGASDYNGKNTISKINLSTLERQTVAFGIGDSSYAYNKIDINNNKYVAAAWANYLAVADFSADIVAPDIDITNIDGQVTLGSTITLTWQATDNLNALSKVEIYKEINGTSTLLTTVTDVIHISSYDYTVNDSEAQFIKFKIVAYDSANNIKYDTVTYQIVAPIQIISFTIDKTTVQLYDSAIFTWAASNAGSSTIYKVYKRKVGSTEWQEYFSVTGELSKSQTFQGFVGDYQFKIVAGDASQELLQTISIQGEIILFDYTKFSPINDAYYVDDKLVDLSWGITFTKENLVSYDLYIKTDSDAGFNKITTTPEKAYQYRVPSQVESFDWKIIANYMNYLYESDQNHVSLVMLNSPNVTSLDLFDNHTDVPYVVVHFDNIQNIDDYVILRKKNSGVDEELSIVTGYLYEDRTVSYGDTYEYSVVSKINNLKGPRGLSKSVFIDIKPVTGITIHNENYGLILGNSLTVTYTPNCEQCYEKYEISIGTNPAVMNQIGITKQKSFYIDNLNYATTYYVDIFPLNFRDARIINTPARLVFTTGMQPTPMPPNSLIVASASSNRIDLSWIDNSSNELGFAIERKRGVNGTYSQIGMTTATTYSDLTSTGGNTYFYRVKAYNSTGDSAYSNIVSYTPVSVDTLPPITVATPQGGGFSLAQSVILVCSDGDGSGCATTYFTTDGSIPTTNSTVYSGAIPISANTTLKFFSVDNAGNNETVKTEVYTLFNTLTVNISGTGFGTVTSFPEGIDCGSDCSESYNYNKTVTLTASASSGSTFIRWSGDLSGSINPANFTMNGSKTVTAEFGPDVGTCHPADTTNDYRIVISECTSYGFAWKTGATWGVDPNPIPIGYMTNACYLWKIGEVYHFDPNTTPPYVTGEGTSGVSSLNAGTGSSSIKSLPSGNVDKSSDRRSSATTTISQSRRLLTGTGRGSDTTGWYGITVEVTPVKGVQGYAVEETLPANAEVQGINNSGNWDRTNGKVKWGPFLDNMPRTLQYQIRDTGAQSPVVSSTGSSSASSTGGKTNAGRASRSAAAIPSSLFFIKGVASFDGMDVTTVNTGSLALSSEGDRSGASLAIWMDFDGDGRSDLTELWEGTLRVALMSGDREIEAEKYHLPSAHKILGYGDWDGDGRADILLGDDSGSTRVWLMEGTKVREEWKIRLPAGAKPLGIGDVNGDGIADLLWRDAQGIIHAEVSAISPESLNTAEMTDALSISRSSLILGWMDSRTEVISLGDYDGDGRTDILWRDGNGAFLISLMEGAGLRTIQIPMITLMMPIGSGDMNGDGMADILWRDASGSLQAWLMNGFSQPKLVQMGQPTPGWEVIGVGDYNGDGGAEILWAYSLTGERRITSIDGPTSVSN